MGTSYRECDPISWIAASHMDLSDLGQPTSPAPWLSPHLPQIHIAHDPPVTAPWRSADTTTSSTG